MTYTDDGSPNLIPNLDAFYQEMFREPMTLEAPVKPASQGVGEAFVDTQFEMSAGKTTPGSITGFDTSTWEMTKKFFLPQINLNNPHNMALSRDQNTIFQSQWFSDKVTAIDRETGKEIRTTEVGPSPSHVMRRPARTPSSSRTTVGTASSSSTRRARRSSSPTSPRPRGRTPPSPMPIG